MTDEDEDEVATKKKKNHPKKKKVSKEAPKKTIKKKEAPKKNDTILKKDKCNLKKAGKNVKVMAVINLMEREPSVQYTIHCGYTKVFNKK
jgi:hypothetical protein